MGDCARANVLVCTTEQLAQLAAVQKQFVACPAWLSGLCWDDDTYVVQQSRGLSVIAGGSEEHLPPAAPQHETQMADDSAPEMTMEQMVRASPASSAYSSIVCAFPRMQLLIKVQAESLCEPITTLATCTANDGGLRCRKRASNEVFGSKTCLAGPLSYPDVHDCRLLWAWGMYHNRQSRRRRRRLATGRCSS